MSYIPRPHDIYKHFKGNLYQITAIAEHTETGEQLVIYQALYGDFRTYARPLEMFMSKVDREKYPDALQEYRFELQSAGTAPQGSNREADDAPQGSSQSVGTVPQGSSQSVGTVPQESSQSESAGTAPQENSWEADAASQEERREDSGSASQSGEEAPQEELNLDPMVIAFLDADTYEERLNILAGLRHRVTDEMITIMAVACDIEVPDGETQERYTSLRNCLLMMEKYECNRLR